MSSKNDETSGAIFVLAMIGAGLAFLAAFVFALAAFLAVIGTIFCLFAWNKPRKLGKEILTPREARMFIIYGLYGLFGLPMFVAFSSLLLKIHVDDQCWPYVFLGGYIVGAFTGAYQAEKLEQDEAATAAAAAERLPVVINPPRAIPRDPQPFQFASWDDEEEQK